MRSPETRIAVAVRELVDNPETPAGDMYRHVLSIAEKPLLEVVLHRNHHNQTHTAQQLGINRNTLRKRAKTLGVKL